MSKKTKNNNNIVLNKKASHEYQFLEDFEAGIVLEGWEVKSLRAGKVNITESYVFLKGNEVFLSGMHITPLNTASTHITPDPIRVRKLLMNRQEINQLIGAVERKGLTLIARSMYWKSGKVKVKVILAKGKKLHDKRASEKEKDWNRDKQRLLKNSRY
ncbi:SsrA-binding protein SmpB [Marinicella sp. W31]|uniref:SsrA-binding protein SmpB n=1 Tax=Marinicella sp. W31 TaxID=3023713 RepID=UPI0037566287